MIFQIMSNKQVIKIVLTGIKYIITLVLGALGGSELANGSISTFLNL